MVIMTFKDEWINGLALHYQHVSQEPFEKKPRVANLPNESAICHFCKVNKTSQIIKIAAP